MFFRRCTKILSLSGVKPFRLNHFQFPIARFLRTDINTPKSSLAWENFQPMQNGFITKIKIKNFPARDSVDKIYKQRMEQRRFYLPSMNDPNKREKIRNESKEIFNSCIWFDFVVLPAVAVSLVIATMIIYIILVILTIIFEPFRSRKNITIDE